MEKRKRKAAPRVRQIKVAPDVVVKVVTPPGTKPVVAVDPVTRTVEIVPVKKAKGWWATLFD